MYRKQVNDRSPLRILERSIRGGLGAGELGVVMARAGVGKTAFLVQIGLDDAMRERQVLHVALGQTLDHVHSWYDALFDELAQTTHLEERETTRALIKTNCVIQTFGDTKLTAERLQNVVTRYLDAIGFRPQAILVDRFDWEAECASLTQTVVALKDVARRLGAELWMTAQTHREATEAHPTAMVPPCAAVQNEVDVAVFLEPRGAHVSVRLLKDQDDIEPPDTSLLLDPDTMRLVEQGEVSVGVTVPASACTLLSGGAAGAEAAFGAEAEARGIGEVTFSVAGRTLERDRGLHELSEAELNQGMVSTAYVESHLHRKLGDDLKVVLAVLWHQVSTAGEVFVVGSIQHDGTVRGGTGWGAELARRLGKPLFVFDQRQNGWFRWSGRAWVECTPPRIRRTRFSGTGTRNLTDAGRRAIAQLFADSF